MFKVYSTGVGSLWKYPMGSQIVIAGKSYIYIGKDEWTAASLFDRDSGLVIEIESLIPDDAEELDILVGAVNLALLLDIQAGRCLSLVQDGWTIGGKGLDIAPYIEELRTLKAIYDTMHPTGK